MRPKLLDLFCCAGGAAMGYHRAGFDVTGVDIDGRYAKRYPFRFVQADAIDYLIRFGDEYDIRHASPPCQAYSITKHSHSTEHVELIEPVRAALQECGGPFVIENVIGAPLINPLMLCGATFGLTTTDVDGTALVLKRHRLFESNQFLLSPGACMCTEYKRRGYSVGGVYGGGSVDRTHAREVRRGGYTPGKAQRAALIGANWMTQDQLSQAIPPAYTEFIGAQLIDQLAVAA